MKWFSRKSLRKQKIPGRHAPKPSSAPKPKYQQPKQPERGPKIVKPRVEVPFIGSSLKVQANPHRQDMSLAALESLAVDAEQHGGVRSIEWNLSGGACAKCQAAAAAGPWNDVQDFLTRRPMQVAPNGKPVGIYGYSHPDCSCSLTVYYADEQTATIAP